MIAIRQNEAGVLLPVKAQPGGKRNAIAGERAGSLKVTVTAAPEKGKANAAIINVLAESLGLRRMDLTLLQGETTSNKVFLVTNVTPEQLTERIDAVLRGERE